jgi:addiction module HigA family antidote
MGWSVTEFSNKLGVSRSAVSRLMKGRCGITPMVALALERIGWSNADFWMRLQSNYDLAQARRELEAKATVGS